MLHRMLIEAKHNRFHAGFFFDAGEAVKCHGFMKFLPVFLGDYTTKQKTKKWRFDIYAFPPAKMLCTFETYKVKWDL